VPFIPLQRKREELFRPLPFPSFKRLVEVTE
jgi:hypothetical protein